ncbi:MAG: hypothetical protein ACRBBP_00470 [Bdellovibrionales bacterium]
MQTGKSKTLELYPSITSDALKRIEYALCPFLIKLPKKLESNIHQITKEFIAYKKKTATTAWHDSVANSLDFHYSSGALKIIEANTNASGFLLSNVLLNDPEKALAFENDLITSFKSVFKNDLLKTVSIIDNDPKAEKMFPEFLMYKDFFKRYVVEASILKTSEVKIQNDSLYLYNRDTDFYLEKNPVLRALWETKKVHLSTSPASYQNIADKKFDVYNSDLLENYPYLNSATLKTFSLNAENKEELWANRKKLFFKPSSSFGSKGVYSGKSVSRKKFDTFEDGYLAQELHPPGKVKNLEDEWKYDIRAFFSENGVQKIIARVYQGQLTNFSKLGGGFALIEWVD